MGASLRSRSFCGLCLREALSKGPTLSNWQIDVKVANEKKKLGAYDLELQWQFLEVTGKTITMQASMCSRCF